MALVYTSEVAVTGEGSAQPPSPKGWTISCLEPLPRAPCLELLLHQERKTHYLQITSPCKNADG